MSIRLLIKTIILCFPAFVPSFLSAQNNNWKKEMERSKDPAKQFEWIMKTLDEKKYKEDYPEMLGQALKLAKETRIDTLLAMAHLRLGGYYQQKEMFNEAWNEFMTSKLFYLKSKRYKDAALCMYYQTTLLITQSLADSMLHFLKRNQPFIDVAASKVTRLRWQSMYPLAYQILNKNKDAKAGLLELLPLALECGDTQLILSTYINLGGFYDDFDSSMSLYSKGLAMTESFPEKRVELLYKIGYAFVQRDDKYKDSALYYFLEAEKNSDKLRNPVFRSNIESSIGDFFINRGEFDLALPYMKKACDLSKDLGLIHHITAIHNLAVCFIALKQTDSAAHYLEINRQGAMKMNDDYQFMLYYQARGEFESLKGDSCSRDALQDFDKSIAYAIKVEEDHVGLSTLESASQCILKGERNSMRQLGLSMLGYCKIYYDLIKINKTRRYRFAVFLNQYAKLEAAYGDKTKAIALYEELTENLSGIQEQGYIKGLGEAVVKYKSDLKDAEITLLNEREKTAAVRNILIVVGLLVVACVAAVIFVLYKREHRTRQLLGERNHKVEQLLREVHHRVKNNLQIVSSFINIQLDKITDYEARAALEDTSTRIMALAGLHQSLYRQDDLSRIQLDQYIEELCKALGSGINQNVQINCDLEDLQLNIDQAIPIGLAVNELITNALKHAFSQKQNGQINVVLKHKDKWQLIVKDNGSGLPENIHPEELQSIGIRLVQDIAERQLNGTFSYYNESGAVFKIEFVPMAA